MIKRIKRNQFLTNIKILWVILILIIELDTFSTYIGTHFFGLEEQNPLYQKIWNERNYQAILSVDIAAIFTMYGFITYFSKNVFKKEESKIPLLFFAILLFSSTVICNFITILLS